MKKCAKCEKTVYPTEELKCLDKTWHKGCFRCWECNMMLSMKNYKGYDKLPYCPAHCPKPKHTQVADTPENTRLAENTKQQSLIKYHEDFEKTKGTKITVADDPETLRVRKTQGVVSNIKYHDHHARAEMMEQNRSLIDQGDNMPQNMGGRDLGHSDFQPAPEVAPPPPQVHQEPKPSPYSARNQGQTTIYNAGGRGKVEPAHGRRVGSIADYDPMNENYGSITQQPYRQQQQHQHQQHHQQQQQQGYQSYNQRAPQQHHQPQQHQMAPPPQAQPQYHQPVRKEPDYHQPPQPAQPPQSSQSSCNIS